MVSAGVIFKRFIQKPEVGLLVNYSKLQAGERVLFCEGKIKDKIIPKDFAADLGTASIQISRDLEKHFPKAQAQIKTVFGNLKSVDKIQNRAKGPVSIAPKILRGVKSGEVNSFESAKAFILDGIGSRVITKSLDKLDKKQIKNMIESLKINNEPLSSKQKILLEKYIYQRKMTPSEELEAFPLFEKFAQPLIEKRSKQVVDNLSLSIIKNRMIKEGLTLEQIKKQGLLPDDLIQRLKNEKIEPLEVTLINNYRGMNGLPEFSSRQIQALRKVTGGKVIIHSRADLADYEKFPRTAYSKEELKEFAVKPSGYRTAQMNIIHKDGTLGEIQFRGSYTNMIGEYEHIAYDLRQGKNTLGPIFDNFKSAISKLTPEEYNEYNKYLEKCYNYYNRLELGLPAIKPKLPRKFDKILSEESMKKLHDTNEARLHKLKEGFKPHFEEVA